MKHKSISCDRMCCLNVDLVSDIGVCESRFPVVLKPRRRDPDCQDVTAIRKGQGCIPTAHNRHDELFSLFPPHGCVSCHLGVCRVIIDGPPRWCTDRTQQRRVCACRFDCRHLSGYLLLLGVCLKS